jgi:EAL and modified HD-GYP domain-containing signal transduction protein
MPITREFTPVAMAHNYGTRHVRVARQAIFNARLEATAYELLYQDTADWALAMPSDRTAAVCRVVVATVAEIGLGSLCGRLPIHLNLPRELIINCADLPLIPERTVIELPTTIQGDDEVLAGITSLREQGFRIALDEYASTHHDERLVRSADIFKLDVSQEPADRLAETVTTLLVRGVALIAERVETPEQFERCRRLGVREFQGSFFGCPETFTARRAPSNPLTALEVLAALQDPDVSPDVLADIVVRDIALLHRLLRLLNSVHFGLPLKIGSVRHAVVMLGHEYLHRFCAVVALSRFEDRPSYLLINAMVRAKMCEIVGGRMGIHTSGELFFAGLLSHLDALLGVSIAEAAASLPLSAAVSSAIISRSGQIGAVLQAVVSFEQGRWADIGATGLDEAPFPAAYTQAVVWAEEAHSFLDR